MEKKKLIGIGGGFFYCDCGHLGREDFFQCPKCKEYPVYTGEVELTNFAQEMWAFSVTVSYPPNTSDAIPFEESMDMTEVSPGVWALA